MKQKSSMQRQRNILLLLIFTVVMATVFVARFFQIGVLKNVNQRDLTAYTTEDEVARSSITEARRGTIFDSKGAPIAVDTTSYSMFAVLKDGDGQNVIKDPDVAAKTLAKYIGLDRDTILTQLTQVVPTDTPYAQVEFGSAGKNLSIETKQAIEAEKIPGIVFISDATRKYLNDVYASHLIGYAVPENPANQAAGIQANVLVGKLGLEAAYDGVLSGNDQNKAAAPNVLAGSDLYLTLDSRLQNKLEELMTRYQTQYQPSALNAYLVEVKTGKLVAAAQRETFNLNTREGIEKEWKNLMVEEAYEPGSTIKILTMSVAYDRQLYAPGETYQSGSIQVYDQVVKDYNLVGWGNITYEEGLARSSNVAMVNLVKRMGDQEWVKKLAEFGFGQTTNFGIANEVEGDFTFDNPVSRTMSGFGQGFSATPIQLLQAFSSVGNNGEMMKIQVVNGVGDATQYQPRSLGKPISQAAANHVLKLMIDTVEKPYGTAVSFKNNNVKVAAKTGTAQIASPDGNGYLSGPNDYYHSVVTFFPADEPKYMLYLSMKQPTNTQGLMGTQILGKLFNEFVDYLLINP